MTKIATFNVNSLRARLPNILEWLKESAPDIALLQEIKCTEETFPRLEIEELVERGVDRGELEGDDERCDGEHHRVRSQPDGAE